MDEKECLRLAHGFAWGRQRKAGLKSEARMTCFTECGFLLGPLAEHHL